MPICDGCEVQEKFTGFRKDQVCRCEKCLDVIHTSQRIKDSNMMDELLAERTSWTRDERGELWPR